MTPDERRDAPGGGLTEADEETGEQPEGAKLSGASLRRSLGRAFDNTFWAFLLLATAAGAACWFYGGAEIFMDALREDLRLFAEILPRIVAALAVAALVQVLVPRAAVARALSEEAGIRGVTLAAGAGVITPGGPMTSFPLVTAIHAAGGGRSALVAYLTSWSTLGVQRILTWEVPLMGAEFAILRAAVSLPLPFVAALMTKLVPQPAIQPKT